MAGSAQILSTRWRLGDGASPAAASPRFLDRHRQDVVAAARVCYLDVLGTPQKLPRFKQSARFGWHAPVNATRSFQPSQLALSSETTSPVARPLTALSGVLRNGGDKLLSTCPHSIQPRQSSLPTAEARDLRRSRAALDDLPTHAYVTVGVCIRWGESIFPTLAHTTHQCPVV